MSNTATKTKQPKTFPRYCTSEIYGGVQNVDRGIAATNKILLSVKDAYLELAKTNSKLQVSVDRELIVRLIEAASMREFYYDEIFKGAELKAGEGFTISREAAIGMFKFPSDRSTLNSDVDVFQHLHNEVERLKKDLTYFNCFLFDGDGMTVNELRRAEFHDAQRTFTQTEQESIGYEKALKAAEAINNVLEWLSDFDGDDFSNFDLRRILTQKIIPDKYGWSKSRFAVSENIIGTINAERSRARQRTNKK